MLTLEQTRDFNRALQNGDSSAAIALLEAQIDLRHADLPRLEKATKIALETSFSDSQHGEFWARCVLHPNASVRRFLRKIILGANEKAAPLFEPLAREIEAFSDALPEDWSEETGKHEAILREAVALLLRCDPEKCARFWVRLVGQNTSERREKAEKIAAHAARETALREARNAEISRLQNEKFPGRDLAEIEWEARNELWQLASQTPAITEMEAQHYAHGDPYGWRVPLEELLLHFLWGLPAEKNQSFARRAQSAVVPVFEELAGAAFETGDETAREVLRSFQHFSLSSFLNGPFLWQNAAPWLELEMERRDEVLLGILCALVSGELYGPRVAEAKNALDLPRLRAGFEKLPNAQTRKSLLQLLGGKRRAWGMDADEFTGAFDEAHGKISLEDESFSSSIQQTVELESRKWPKEFKNLASDDERIAWLVRAPWTGNSFFDRRFMLSLWLEKLNSIEKVTAWQQNVWPILEEKLGAHFEARLQEFKAAKTETRWPIEADLLDLAALWRSGGGIAAAQNALQLARKFKARSLENSLREATLREAGQVPFDAQTNAPILELEPEWNEFLAECEGAVAKMKSAEAWQKDEWLSLIAMGYYRAGNREKCREICGELQSVPLALPHFSFETGDYEFWLFSQTLAETSPFDRDELAKQWKIFNKKQPDAWLKLLEILAQTSSGAAAKTAIENLAALGKTDFQDHGAFLQNALESPLPLVRRWAMKAISQTEFSDFDWENAARISAENLWSENLSLAKESAKFLVFCAKKSDAAAPICWSSLGEALALENLGVLETVFRALKAIKKSRPDLQFDESVRARLESLREIAPERFKAIP